MHVFKLENKWLIWPLFLFLFAYVSIRAIFVDALFDELATVYWYIQTGYLPGRGATMDANNHVLNSLVSHQLFRLFGDYLFVYRIFALSTFPIYFFACRNLLVRLDIRYKVLVFIALLSIHWIVDYFSLSRGYGPSMAFFMLGLVLIVKWNEQPQGGMIWKIIGIFILALLCNLSLLIPLLLLFGYLVVSIIMKWKSGSVSMRILSVSACLFFVAFLVPVVIYMNKLKKGGALWWGDDSGFWEVTGKSISRVVFFSDGVGILCLILLVIGLSAFVVIRSLFQKGFASSLLTSEVWIPAFFLLALSAVFWGSKLMEVNYPMDRVGMYFVPLLILSAACSFSQLRIMRVCLLGLCWFPFSFVWKLNVNTTQFSPEDRIHRSFYEELRKQLGSTDCLSADYVAHACYAYASRVEEIPHLATNYQEEDTLTKGDYHLAWLYECNWPGYVCVLQDSISGMRLYKRSKMIDQSQLILDTLLEVKQGKETEAVLLGLNTKELANRVVRLSVSGEVSTNPFALKLNLVTELLSSSQEVRRVDNTRFDWYFGRKQQFAFRYGVRPIWIHPGDQVLQLKVINDDQANWKFSKLRICVEID